MPLTADTDLPKRNAEKKHHGDVSSPHSSSAQLATLRDWFTLKTPPPSKPELTLPEKDISKT